MATGEWSDIWCWNEFFRFVKFDSRNNNIYIKIKKSLLRNDGESAET
jgi:hypothetical protein